jgi:hypothetical protein
MNPNVRYNPEIHKGLPLYTTISIEIGHGVPSILDNNPELFNKVIATIKQTSSVDYGIRSSSLNDEKELKADLYAISKIGKEELKNKIAKDLFGFNNLDSLFEEPNE